MAAANNTGIYPPTLPCSLDEMIYSVEAHLPVDLEDELRRYAEEAGTSFDDQMRNVLECFRQKMLPTHDRLREHVAWAKAMLGPERPKKKLSARQLQRVQKEISEMRAEGELGNLILPQELYEFVTDSVESGAFSSPTEILTFAIDFFRDDRGGKPSPRSSRASASFRYPF